VTSRQVAPEGAENVKKKLGSMKVDEKKEYHWEESIKTGGRAATSNENVAERDAGGEGMRQRGKPVRKVPKL